MKAKEHYKGIICGLACIALCLIMCLTGKQQVFADTSSEVLFEDDFDNYEVGATSLSEDFEAVDYVEVVELEEGNKALQFNQYGKITLDSDSLDKQVTFDFKYEGSFTSWGGIYNKLHYVTGDSDEYYVSLHPVHTDKMMITNNGSQVKTNTNKTTNQNTWYTWKTILKDGTMSAKIWEKGTEEPDEWDITGTIDRSLSDDHKYILYVNPKNDMSKTTVDNLKITTIPTEEPVDPEGPYSYFFDNYNSYTTGPVSEIDMDEKYKIPDEYLSYLSIVDTGDTARGNVLSASDWAAVDIDCDIVEKEVSFDYKYNGAITKHGGLFVKLLLKDGSNEQYFSINPAYGSDNIMISDTLNGDLQRETKSMTISNDTWYSVKSQLKDETIYVKVWPSEEDEPEGWTFSKGLRDLGVEDGNALFRIEFSFQDGMTGTTMQIDNLSIKTWKKQFTITADVNDDTMGTVSGAGIYEDGEQVTVTATANEGYQFVNWTKAGAEVSKAATYTFTAEESVELVANFKAIEEGPYSYFFDNYDSYTTGPVSAEDMDAKYIITDDALSIVNSGDTARGNVLSTSSKTSVGIDCSVVEKEVSLDFKYNGTLKAHGGLFVKLLRKDEGNDQYFSINPAFGSENIMISDNLNSDLQRTTTPMTISNDTWYSVKSQLKDETIYVKVWPSAEDEPEDWTCSQKLRSLAADDENALFRIEFSYPSDTVATMQIDNLSIKTWKRQFAINADVNDDTMGTVSGNGTYWEGKTATLQADPKPGCQFVNWTDEGGNVLGTDASYTIDSVSQAITITANFATKPVVEISTAAQLAAITDLAGNYKLTANIDMSGVEFTPIGTYSEPFTGSFDGGDYVISNLLIDSSEKNQGLFGYNAGYICNVTLDDTCSITGSGSTGGIAGYNKGTITGCNSAAKVTCKEIETKEEYTLMSQNLWIHGAGENTVAKRQPKMLARIQEASPDLISFQEGIVTWVDYLKANLTDYTFIYKYRAASEMESTPVAYKTDKFEEVESGYFYLSETPEVESKGWDAANYRNCSYVVLRDKDNGNILALFGVHLDFRETALKEGAKLIHQRVLEMYEKYGDIMVFAAGDYNAVDTSEAYLVSVEDGMVDVRFAVENNDVNTVTYVAATEATTDDEHIDYIMASDSHVNVLQYKVLPSRLSDGTYTSDHNGLMCTFSSKQYAFGGIVGTNAGTISDVTSTATVTGGTETGSVVGLNVGSVDESVDIATKKEELKALIDQAEAMGGDVYEASKWESFEAALNAAKAEYNSDNTTVKDLTDALDALQSAIAALEYKDADYTKVEAALEKVPADLSKYTEESAKALNDAVDAVEEGKDITKQAEVDAMAKAIEDAIAALKYKDADYTKVEAALEKVPADLSKYTDESVKALNDAIDAVVEGKDITEQSVVDGYANAIEDAIASLEEKKSEETPGGNENQGGNNNEDEIKNPFTDVSKDSIFYDSIMWAYENGITTGRTKTTFEPLANCTRGEGVTFLWRAEGCPEPTITKNPFTDVSETSPYYKAILWAYENGITTGKTATTFQPGVTVTREQFVTFLWRNAGKPSSTVKNPFVDVVKDRYSTTAILWAYENGITTGKTATTFQPDASSIRQHVVTFLYRAYN